MNEGIIAVSSVQGEPRIDSRMVAERLGLKHKSTIELITKYLAAFEQLGNLPFQTETSPRNSNGAVHEIKFALLNEDQSYFLLTLNRNTEKVILFKLELVKAFSAARATPILPILSPLEILAQVAIGAAALEKRLELVVSKTTALEQKFENMPMDSEKRGRIYKLGQQLGGLIGWRKAWGLFNDRFSLAAYASLPNCKFEEGMQFLHLQLEAYGGPSLLDGNPA